jgi:two-component system, OmpR family, response regulator PhoP
MARIIIVEDDLGQQEELQSFLMYAGHEVLAVSSGKELDKRLQFVPEIALLDYNLPGETGMELALRLRKQYGSAIGLVMVTARSMGADRVECRRAGADDYLVKPINFGELLALIDNLYRRMNPPVSGEGEEVWRLFPVRSELVPPGAPAIPLSGLELILLKVLASTQNRQADRDTLIRAMGKNPFAYDPRALEANISRLRRKLPPLEDGRNPLQALRGMGYQFIRPLVIVS